MPYFCLPIRDISRLQHRHWAITKWRKDEITKTKGVGSGTVVGAGTAAASLARFRNFAFSWPLRNDRNSRVKARFSRMSRKRTLHATREAIQASRTSRGARGVRVLLGILIPNYSQPAFPVLRPKSLPCQHLPIPTGQFFPFLCMPPRPNQDHRTILSACRRRT